MNQKQCRLWWPEHLAACEASGHILLFGWCIHSSLDSVDYIVVTGASEEIIHRIGFENVLDHVNKRMPQSLKSQTAFRLLGYCGLRPSRDGNSTSWIARMNSDYELNGFNDWVHLEYSRDSVFMQKPILKLHHLCLNGQMSPAIHTHFIVYELPSFGSHHFSLSDWKSVNQPAILIKKPRWLSELGKEKSLLDLESVISSLNCANAARDCTEKSLGFYSSPSNCSMMSRLITIGWHALAILAASFSTIIYICALLLHRYLIRYPYSIFLGNLINPFPQTAKIVQIRCSQFLYWSFFLQGSTYSSHPNVEYAHKTALKKHSIWSSIVIDLMLGVIFGLLTLSHVDDIHSLMERLSCVITDDLLRSGCVWLMGVPAGFKLNIELAELLGLVSLNAIQIWSTLWFYVGPLLRSSLVGFAFSGIFLGATIPLALFIDFLKLAALHVTMLHAVISFLYSRQIWALTSLWRLFRGQKWNPLRQRLDSFDYSVDQHVVGSLLFTPILLLLPTTSVFYIFFTIIDSCVSLLCILLELSIFLIHVTPYTEIFLWILAPARFPSGIWLELNQIAEDSQEQLVSTLRSNYAQIGQILGAHYRDTLSQVSILLRTSVSGVLSGQGMLSTLGVSFPKVMPWRKVKPTVYWQFCRFAVLSYAPKGVTSRQMEFYCSV